MKQWLRFRKARVLLSLRFHRKGHAPIDPCGADAPDEYSVMMNSQSGVSTPHGAMGTCSLQCAAQQARSPNVE